MLINFGTKRVLFSGAAWHLDRVEIRRLLDNQKTSTYVFPCNRWFAKNEDDRQIIRELVPDKVIEEKLTRDGQLRVKEKDVRDRLDSKKTIVFNIFYIIFCFSRSFF